MTFLRVDRGFFFFSFGIFNIQSLRHAATFVWEHRANDNIEVVAPSFRLTANSFRPFYLESPIINFFRLSHDNLHNDDVTLRHLCKIIVTLDVCVYF